MSAQAQAQAQARAQDLLLRQGHQLQQQLQQHTRHTQPGSMHLAKDKKAIGLLQSDIFGSPVEKQPKKIYNVLYYHTLEKIMRIA